MRRRDIRCERCGEVAEQDTTEIVQLASSKPVRVMYGPAYCTTPGCVDESGSDAVQVPPTADELRDEAYGMWLDWHRRLTEPEGAGMKTETMYAKPRDPRNRHRHALGGHVAWGRIHDTPMRLVEVHRWWIQFSLGTRYLWIGR